MLWKCTKPNFDHKIESLFETNSHEKIDKKCFGEESPKISKSKSYLNNKISDFEQTFDP